MLIVISPAKKQGFDFPWTGAVTVPQDLARSEQLVTQLKSMTAAQLAELMKVSDSIAELNYQRFQQFETPFDSDNARPAMLAFKGDVYTGLAADQFTAEELEFAEQHLRILSGLYGALRPLDLIQPYRLEMGTRLPTARGRNLYQFWGERITERLNETPALQKDQVLINLASNEYFRSVKPGVLAGRIITPVFKELRDGKYRIISFSAKRARGQLAAAIIRQKMQDPEQIKSFAEDRYQYTPELSTDSEFVFCR